MPPDPPESGATADLASMLAAERPRLVRLCARLSGHAEAADDLAQETLLEAWRNTHKLHDPSGLAAWLNAIARNVCLRDARRRGRDAVHLKPLVDETAHLPDDTTDLSVTLERDDLARLLDRAMAMLPPETRAVLVQRYVEESPQAQVALRLGLSEGAVAMRLRRGTFTLRRLLATELRAEAEEFGLTAAGSRWSSTRIWCPFCGTHRLEGRLIRASGEFTVRCPGCNARLGRSISQAVMPLLHRGTGSAGDGFSRLLDWLYGRYWEPITAGMVRCVTCEQLTPPLVRPLTYPQTQLAARIAAPMRYEASTRCSACGERVIALATLAATMPEGRRFWREHPRMRLLPERDVDICGQPAVALGLESVTDSARFEVIVLRGSLAVAGIHTAG